MKAQRALCRQQKGSLPGATLSLIGARLQPQHQTGQQLHPVHATHAPPAPPPAVACKHHDANRVWARMGTRPLPSRSSCVIHICVDFMHSNNDVEVTVERVVELQTFGIVHTRQSSWADLQMQCRECAYIAFH